MTDTTYRKKSDGRKRRKHLDETPLTGALAERRDADGRRQISLTAAERREFTRSEQIETAVRHRLPVTYVVLCDRQLGMVKYSQSMAVDGAAMMADRTLPPEKLVGTDFSEIRFDRLAESMGAHGERVSNAADLAEALKRCLASGRCSVVHVDVDRVEHLWAPGLDVFKAMHQI